MPVKLYTRRDLYTLTVTQRDNSISWTFMPFATYMEPNVLISDIALFLDRELEDAVGVLDSERVWTMTPGM